MQIALIIYWVFQSVHASLILLLQITGEAVIRSICANPATVTAVISRRVLLTRVIMCFAPVSPIMRRYLVSKMTVHQPTTVSTATVGAQYIRHTVVLQDQQHQFVRAILATIHRRGLEKIVRC